VAYSVIGDDARWLRENMELELLLYEGEVIDYNLPLNIDLEVVEAEQGVAGDTATGATKEVVTETGVKVRTPLFVEVGDRIRVDTRSGEYVTRV
jgi:elongation factor P